MSKARQSSPKTVSCRPISRPRVPTTESNPTDTQAHVLLGPIVCDRKPHLPSTLSLSLEQFPRGAPVHTSPLDRDRRMKRGPTDGPRDPAVEIGPGPTCRPGGAAIIFSPPRTSKEAPPPPGRSLAEPAHQTDAFPLPSSTLPSPHPRSRKTGHSKAGLVPISRPPYQSTRGGEKERKQNRPRIRLPPRPPLLN
ncbi:hypothetical protein NL676_013708 [Syzygium grande]|nr:hypothetical protein NL676_013708 [Syzygium grande]